MQAAGRGHLLACRQGAGRRQRPLIGVKAGGRQPAEAGRRVDRGRQTAEATYWSGGTGTQQAEATYWQVGRGQAVSRGHFPGAERRQSQLLACIQGAARRQKGNLLAFRQGAGRRQRPLTGV
jgi:hypothetical protein